MERSTVPDNQQPQPMGNVFWFGTLRLPSTKPRMSWHAVFEQIHLYLEKAAEDGSIENIAE
jgi:hypothetical protein